MKPIKIFRHIDCEGPGYFADVLNREKIPFTMVCIDQGEAFSTSIDDCSALVFMGGPMSVNDDLAWIRQELELIQLAVKHGMPVLGHCLGGQLLAKALGAGVYANPVKEIGWHTVQTAATHPVLAGVPADFLAFHWHGETFELPTDADLILENDHCRHQGFIYQGNCLGLQCHVEMTADMVRTWVDRYSDELSGPPSVQSASLINADVEEKCQALQKVADTLYSNWLKTLKC